MNDDNLVAPQETGQSAKNTKMIPVREWNNVNGSNDGASARASSMQWKRIHPHAWS